MKKLTLILIFGLLTIGSCLAGGYSNSDKIVENFVKKGAYIKQYTGNMSVYRLKQYISSVIVSDNGITIFVGNNSINYSPEKYELSVDSENNIIFTEIPTKK